MRTKRRGEGGGRGSGSSRVPRRSASKAPRVAEETVAGAGSVAMESGLSMRESLGAKGNLRWIPTWLQVADALTKRDRALRMKMSDWLQRPYAQLHD